MANGNGDRRFSSEGFNNVTIFLVVVVLAVAWSWVFVFGPADKVDGTMFERVLIFVLGVGFGGQIAKKGVEQGTALTPAPPSGSTTTTTTTMPTTPGGTNAPPITPTG